MPALGDELVRECWRQLHSGQPYRALTLAERALRLHRPAVDSLVFGRLSLVVGIALEALGRSESARRYLEDASWALEQARVREVSEVPAAPPGPLPRGPALPEPVRRDDALRQLGLPDGG